MLKIGISNIITDGEDDVRNAENYASNEFNNDTNTANTNSGNYNAARTAAETDINSANNTTTWIILAVAAAAIIGLVWYYFAQANNDRD